MKIIPFFYAKVLDQNKEMQSKVAKENSSTSNN